MPIPAKIKTYLTKTKAKFEPMEHKTVFTVYDLSQTTKVKMNAIVKTLLVKADAEYKLVLLAANRRLNIPALQKMLGAKNVRMAKEGEMAKQFKIKPGAMSPFGKLHKVEVVMDRGLVKLRDALFGAGSFTDSVRMKMKDYVKLEEPAVGSISEAPKNTPAKKKTKKR